MKTFWEFKALANKKGELFLYGEISDMSWWGDEISPAQFQKDLAALGQIDQLDVYINSPGGDVFAGLTIYQILKRHEANVTVHVDGLAASAASIVAMAGDKIVMPKAATMMIHNAWSGCWGNKATMRALADELERLDSQLADIYTARTKKAKEDVLVWMDSERWMSGDEAFADGFADELEENKQIAACADTDKVFARYQHPPYIAKPGDHTHCLGDQNHTHDISRHPPRAEPDQSPTAETGGILLPAVDDDTKPYIPTKAEPADNGAEMQPVADKTPDTLEAQRRQFTQIRKKLLEV